MNKVNENHAADWSREHIIDWNPGKKLVRSIRDYQSAKGLFKTVKRKWAVLRHRFWSAVSGADIPLNSRLGGGFLLGHATGVVIHPDCKIGKNCLVQSCVTIGVNGSEDGLPTIGDNVEIGTGAKILGGVTIGDGARIGANAVVLQDVPPGYTAVGVPARLMPPKEKK